MAFPTKRTPKGVTNRRIPDIDTIRKYLVSKGWKLTYNWQQKIEYYDNDDYADQEVKLTVDKKVNKFDERLQAFFDDLADIEGKKKINLVEDIFAVNDIKCGILLPDEVTQSAVQVTQASEINDSQSSGIPEGRLNNGRFSKGHSFSRMPKSINGSSICSYRAQIAEHVPAAIVFLKEIMEGEHTDIPIQERQLRVASARAIIDYVVPAPKALTYIDVEINKENLKTVQGVKEESIKIVKQLEDSNASIESVAALLEVLQIVVKFIEVADIEPRLREIEYQMAR